LENKGSILIVDNLEAGYGSIKVLHGVAIEIKQGEITVLLGTNGNGKSTLLKCIAGILTPEKGKITYKMENGSEELLIGKSPDEVVELGISLIPEGRRLFPHLTVEENLKMGAYRKKARNRIKENLSFVYDFFPILKERRRQLAGTLSGGEQQMLAIARGLMSNPRILLIDEPSIGLAPIIISKLMSTIRDLRESYELSILMAEQNFSQAIKIADRGYIMVHGKIIYEGDVNTLKNHELVKKFYLTA